MKTALFVVALTLGCGSTIVSNTGTITPTVHNTEWLQWCKVPGDGIWQIVGTGDKKYLTCPGGEYVTADWGKFPLVLQAHPSLVTEVKEAIEIFNEQVAFNLFDYADGNQDPDIFVVEGTHETSSKLGEAKLMTLDGDMKGLVIMYNGISRWDRSDVVFHELGHIVGLSHDKKDKGSIMFPSIIEGTMQELREEDAFALQERFIR